jgi:hypothetical protein
LAPHFAEGDGMWVLAGIGNYQRRTIKMLADGLLYNAPSNRCEIPTT